MIIEKLNNLGKIKTYDELMVNYKNIRNSLLFYYFDYSLDLSLFTIKKEMERISRDIEQEINEDENKLKIFNEKMEILVERKDLGINAAAYQ